MNSTRQNKTCNRKAFTLVELLVVIAVLFILASVFGRAIAAKPSSQTVQCMENQRRLVIAWRMYADDNNDLLPPNDYPYTTSFVAAGNKDQLRNWVVGTMQQAFDAGSDPINTLLAPQTLLSGYIRTVNSYKCPACTGRIQGRPLPRNYSMSLAIGTRWSSGYGQLGTDSSKRVGDPVGGGWLSGIFSDPDPNYLTFGKINSLFQPGPAHTWVLIDENPLSINDGLLAVSMETTIQIDFPSGLHAGAAVLTFADDHAETHKWKSPLVFSPNQSAQQGMVNGSSLTDPDAMSDMAWLAARTAAHR
jgi:prepilin-type N-terminal cleavage/methylation domain-containing protein